MQQITHTEFNALSRTDADFRELMTVNIGCSLIVAGIYSNQDDCFVLIEKRPMEQQIFYGERDFDFSPYVAEANTAGEFWKLPARTAVERDAARSAVQALIAAVLSREEIAV